LNSTLSDLDLDLDAPSDLDLDLDLDAPSDLDLDLDLDAPSDLDWDALSDFLVVAQIKK
jgi:hypothetical protein